METLEKEIAVTAFGIVTWCRVWIWVVKNPGRTTQTSMASCNQPEVVPVHTLDFRDIILSRVSSRVPRSEVFEPRPSDLNRNLTNLWNQNPGQSLCFYKILAPQDSGLAFGSFLTLGNDPNLNEGTLEDQLCVIAFHSFQGLWWAWQISVRSLGLEMGRSVPGK